VNGPVSRAVHAVRPRSVTRLRWVHAISRPPRRDRRAPRCDQAACPPDRRGERLPRSACRGRPRSSLEPARGAGVGEALARREALALAHELHTVERGVSSISPMTVMPQAQIGVFSDKPSEQEVAAHRRAIEGGTCASLGMIPRFAQCRTMATSRGRTPPACAIWWCSKSRQSRHRGNRQRATQ
jgi:hypothetical protein